MKDLRRKASSMTDKEVLHFIRANLVEENEYIWCPKCKKRFSKEVGFCPECGTEAEHRTEFYYYTSWA